MKQIRQWLHETVGLSEDSIGFSSIQRSVRLKMRESRVNSLEEYRQLLSTSQSARDALVESLVVTETWFFRNADAFSGLAQLARDLLPPQTPNPGLRLLSIPCASGEEPFSAAMALRDAGFTPAQLHIDAVDISSRMLRQCRVACYGRNSFRGDDFGFRSRYFRPTTDGYVLDQSVRGCVHFEQANLLSEGWPDRTLGYDFIFCRNLLIYLNPAAQRRVLEKLEGILSPAGALFLGPAELPLALDYGFAATNLPMAFACRKAASGRPAVIPQTVLSIGHPTKPLTYPPASAGDTAALLEKPLQCTRGASHLAPEDLEAAHRLADMGRLAEAAAACEAHLRTHPPSAHAYFLLGLIRDARGDHSAFDCYRRALYLEPENRDALMQIALLAEKRGDLKGALNFRRRAQRDGANQ